MLFNIIERSIIIQQEGEKGKLTNIQGAMLIANTILGAGMLTLPIVYKYFGFILGTIFLIIFSQIPVISAKILLLLHRYTKKSGFSNYGKIALGNSGSTLVKLVIIVNNFGACALFFRINADVINKLVDLFIDENALLNNINYNQWIYIVFIGIILLPIVLKENVDALSVIKTIINILFNINY